MRPSQNVPCRYLPPLVDTLHYPRPLRQRPSPEPPPSPSVSDVRRSQLPTRHPERPTKVTTKTLCHVASLSLCATACRHHSSKSTAVVAIGPLVDCGANRLNSPPCCEYPHKPCLAHSWFAGYLSTCATPRAAQPQPAPRADGQTPTKFGMNKKNSRLTLAPRATSPVFFRLPRDTLRTGALTEPSAPASLP